MQPDFSVICTRLVVQLSLALNLLDANYHEHDDYIRLDTLITVYLEEEGDNDLHVKPDLHSTLREIFSVPLFMQLQNNCSAPVVEQINTARQLLNA